MKSLRIVLVMMSFSCLVQAQDIKTMTYNIHHGNPPANTGGAIDLPSVASVISGADADLVALQEVDKNTTRSGNVNQAAVLANLTGMYYYFSRSIDYQGGEYGVAILSKYPIVESFRFQLPMAAGAGGEARSVAVIAVMVNGQKLYFACTHFDTVEANRLLQAQAVADTVANYTLPFVIGGDMNATPSSSAINILRSKLYTGCTSCQFTASAVAPSKTIDYVLFNEAALQQYYIKDYTAINEPLVSDHLPVKAVLASHPAKIAGWQFANPQTEGNEINVSAATVGAGLNQPVLTRGAGLRTVSNTNADIKLSRGFAAGSVYASSAALADTAVAIANDMYFAFSLKALNNYRVTLSSIDYKIRISAGGAKTWYWKYSTDGVNFRQIAPPVSLTGATDSEGAWQSRLHLSTITGLRNITAATTVYFRLYVSGSNATTGSTAIGRSASGNAADDVLKVNGIVEPLSATSVMYTSGTTIRNAPKEESSFFASFSAGNLIVKAEALKPGKAFIRLADMTGRILVQAEEQLSEGLNSFDFQVSPPVGVYVVQLHRNGKTESVKIMKQY